MAEDLEEETEILEDVEEETEDVQAEEDGEGSDAGDGENSMQGETVAQDEVLDKYKMVYDQGLDRVKFPSDISAEIQRTWKRFLEHAGTPEHAGELIFGAWWEAAPSLHSYFLTPKTVLHLRIVQGISPIVAALGHPNDLRTQVEIICFRHLDRPVSVQGAEVVRDSMLDMWEAELGADFTPKARIGWFSFLNYWGGALVYFQREYAGRIKIIHRSWREANKSVALPEEEEEVPATSEIKEDEEAQASMAEDTKKEAAKVKEYEGQVAEGEGERKEKSGSQMKVPTTFREMFLFNAAVMGFGGSTWMDIILDQFDALVVNIASSYRLQEECDVLVLVLSKNTEPIALSDFRAVMLATLRSLAPKDWDTEHEVAWNWLWENVERILKGQLGKPKSLERALTHFIASWSEEQAMFFRKELYKRFFALAPSGQDFFKQSSTRLYFLADRVVEMTVEMFREPRKMVQEISGLGLRHVGWGIPPELFGPYTSGAVESVRSMTTDDNTQSAFRFSLSLIAKILVRAVSEGSTLVMRAINTNQESAMKKAIAIAPRGKRAMELLNISVGTQSISPLFWSIESGSLNSARAMIVDLLTIRADRDVYYYGCDAMFTRHPDLILRLCNDASTLLWTLFDGLVWRSRLVQDGQRRVNYYIKHLVQDLEGNFSPALKWLAHHKDPRLVSHGVVMTFADLLWNRVASYQFLLGRGYFLFTLLVFITSQSFLVPGEERLWRNILTFVCRCFLYLGSMSKLLFDQCKLACSAFKAGDYQWYWVVPVPNYLHSTQQAGSALLVLLLILMYAQEPILWCISYAQTGGDKAMIFTTTCPEALDVMTPYTVFSCIAMLIYWALLMDFTLLSMRISAFVLVCGNVLADVGLFSLALVFLILMFATAISSLNHHVEGFDGVGPWLTGLLQITLGMFPPSKYEDFRSDIPVLIAVSVFVAVLSIFLVNLLVAQLNQSYRDIFEDMQGFARLNRAGVTADIIEQVSRKRWSKFLSHLRFDEPLEFNEGDDVCQDCTAGRYGDQSGQSSLDDCLLCDPGTWSSEGLTFCYNCSAGRWSDTIGGGSISTCIACAAGRISTLVSATSIETCVACPVKTFASQSASTACEDCQPRQASFEGSSSCSDCGAGFYEGPTSCEQCPVARYSDSKQASCSQCEAGYVVNSHRTACIPCSRGRFSDTQGAEACQDCGAGRYGIQAGGISLETACQECPAGRVSNGLAVTSLAGCLQCSPGNFAGTTGGSSCEPCQAGRYQESPGQSACTFCEAGRFIGATGSSLATECEACPAGRSSTSGSGSCTDCPVGTNAVSEGQSACTECPATNETGSIGCCPGNSEQWPLSRGFSMSLPPGKSASVMHVLSNCQDKVDPLSAELAELVISDERHFEANPLSLATIRPAGIHSCIELHCGSNNTCAYVQPEETDFRPGSKLQVYAEVSRRLPEGGLTSYICPSMVSLSFAGFGCQEGALLSFGLVHLVVIFFTLFLAILVELFLRWHVDVFLEVALDISSSNELAPLPSTTELKKDVMGTLQLKTNELLPERFQAWKTNQEDKATRVQMEFQIAAIAGADIAVRESLLAKTNAHTLCGRPEDQVAQVEELYKKVDTMNWKAEGPWAKSEGLAVSRHPLAVVKEVGRLPGADLVDTMEAIGAKCVRSCCSCFCRRLPRLTEENEALRLRAAKAFLEAMMTRSASIVLCINAFVMLLLVFGLPLQAREMMTCGTGYPYSIHFAWLGGWTITSTLSNGFIFLEALKVDKVAVQEFMGRFSFSLLLRFFFAFVSVTDLYQDVTFPVISYRCGFDLWFVSTWLVILGAGPCPYKQEDIGGLWHPIWKHPDRRSHTGQKRAPEKITATS